MRGAKKRRKQERKRKLSTTRPSLRNPDPTKGIFHLTCDLMQKWSGFRLQKITVYNGWPEKLARANEKGNDKKVGFFGNKSLRLLCYPF